MKNFIGKVIVNPQNIDWENKSNYLFLHPKEQTHLPFLNQTLLDSHIFILTSGSFERKCVALSKKAFLNSAKSVNQHLKVKKEDRWLIGLSLSHVGGLSILARSFLSQSSYFIFKEKWSPKSFASQIHSNNITLTSLVPTQVYDLVVKHILAPPSLRAVVVGGGSLSPSLYHEARKLRWPLLPSYGLTEACSQVATAPLDSLNSLEYPDLKILSHCEVQIIKGTISLKSSSLLTGWYSLSFKDGSHSKMKKCDTAYLTEDRGEIQGFHLKVEGRDQAFKIQGHSVSLMKLKKILIQVCLKQKIEKNYHIIATPQSRTGYQIDLVTDDSCLDSVQRLITQFNTQVFPFERVCQCYIISQIPQGEIKVQLSSLKTQLGISQGLL